LSQALRKLALIDGRTGRFEDLIRFCEAHSKLGPVNPMLTAIHATALAGTGRIEEAEDIRSLNQLLWQGALPTPDTFNDINTFNAALAAELQAHPALRFENSRRASHATWRIDELLVSSSTQVRKLLECICDQVERYISDIVEPAALPIDHPFMRYRPDRAKILSWALIAGGKGHENWHVHGRGWISGVYYISIPDGLPSGGAAAGAIDFGWWEEVLGAGSSERIGQRRIHPTPGMLLLFPSHIHHRTWPHETDQNRICVSFDIVPC
jgi:hypothetical protein